MRRRVLHIIDTGGPGGAETVLLNVASGLDADRWQSTVAVPAHDWLESALHRAGVHSIFVPTHGSFDLRYLARLISLCRSGIDVIHSHLLMTAVYGRVAAAIAGVPIVSTFHGMADISGGNRLRDLKFRMIDRLGSGRVTFVSESLRRSFLEAVPLDRTRTAVVPNGIDATRFERARDAELRRTLASAEDEVLIGAIGNIRPSKSYDVLLRAAAALRTRGVPFRIVIAGQGAGNLRDELEALHAQLELGGLVHFLGFREDIPQIMSCLDIYVSSSTLEGFSLTTVEAMAAGLPVVAARSGGPEDIIDDGVTGVLVPAQSPDALAAALETLIRDPAMRQRLGCAARRVASSRYTIPAMVSGYQQLYEEAIAERRGGVRR